MAGNGPAPKDPSKRARRNATVSMIMLPAEGRPGRAPAWPLGGDIEIETEIFMAQRELVEIDDEIEWASTARDRAAQRRKIARVKKKITELEAMKKHAGVVEREIWSALWKTPQAVQWEKRGWFRDVALYARLQAKGEAGDLNSAKEARMKEDRIGLNDAAMLKLRWAIAEKATPSRRPRGGSPAPKSAKGRRGPLHAVPDIQTG